MLTKQLLTQRTRSDRGHATETLHTPDKQPVAKSRLAATRSLHAFRLGLHPTVPTSPLEHTRFQTIFLALSCTCIVHVLALSGVTCLSCIFFFFGERCLSCILIMFDPSPFVSPKLDPTHPGTRSTHLTFILLF
jgi:hypothetical protein